MIERNFDGYFQQVNELAGKKDKKGYEIENLFEPIMINHKCEIVLRLLPQPATETAPFVENRTHSFKDTDGKWKVVDCLRKNNHKCPLCDWNSAVFDAFPKEKAKDVLKKLGAKKAKKTYICNVYVVKHPGNPDSEGKVYRFKFGVQIMDKLLEKLNGKDDPDKGHIAGVNVFDYYKGANLIYKAKDTEFGPNPEESYFGDQKPISDKNNNPLTDEEIEAIDAKLYTLKECEKDTSKETFEEVLDTYEKLAAKKLYDRTKEDPQGKYKYQPIIPGVDPSNTVATNESVRSEDAEPAAEKPSSENIDEFLNDLT